jgi:serine/threonine protein kinase
MTPERWQQITDLFDAASEREPSDRTVFLTKACRGDEELRRELENLLRVHELAGSFLNRPAVQVATEGMAKITEPTLLGQHLGPYQILSLLGVGGMGEVYHAQDVRLKRTVAIKVLPAHLSNDTDLRQRFEREARTVSNLSHPHICPIYDIGQQNGVDFLVMEYLEGETLAQRLERAGRLPLKEALHYALEIASALEEAHRLGIVHRDLKPGNVMLTKGGVKLLDFGLAKWEEEPQSGTHDLSVVEIGDTNLSLRSMIRGTLSYMSPEQAGGKELDARSDIFSFGSVLYEMVMGQKAFQGDSALSTLSAILWQDPRPTVEIRDDLPDGLQSIIDRCLQKDRERRWRTMGEVRVALDEMKEAEQSISPVRTARSEWNRQQILIWAVVILVVVAVLGSVWLNRQTRQPPATVPTVVPLTSYPGQESEPSFSPDGKQVAFTWNGDKQDNLDIYVKRIGNQPPNRLTTNPENDHSPTWSPDGSRLAFLRDLPEGAFGRASHSAHRWPGTETGRGCFYTLSNPRGSLFNLGPRRQLAGYR